MKEVTKVYKIYYLESPDHLKVVEPDGYYMKTKYRQVLIDLDDEVDKYRRNEFDSMEEAIQFLEENKSDKDFMGKKFTILPIVEIDYNY